MLLLILTCCLAVCSATKDFYIPELLVEPESASVSRSRSGAGSGSGSGTLLYDTRPPPNVKAWTLETKQDALQRRGLEMGDEEATTKPSSSSSSSSSSSTTTSSSSNRASMTATTDSTPTTASAASSSQSSQPTSSTLPTAFDTGFAGNITESCSNFMDSFLDDATFKSCLPLSLLLQNSDSFFQACKSVLTITQTLDATCAANVGTCTTYMNSIADNITDTTACASDISQGNPMILQAQLGLRAYQTLYTASCLRNPTTSAYCFADAITNSSAPTDSYIYYLPLNISLPGGSQPTCDTCLVNTMAVFEAATANRSSSIADDYASAAEQINVQCGPGFVNTSLAVASNPSAAGRTSIPGADLALVVLMGALILTGF